MTAASRPLRQSAFGVLTPVQADGSARVSHSHQCVPEARIAKLVQEAQPDQGPADDERDDGGDEHVDDDDPEQRPGQCDATDRQRPGQPPQDCAEREHRQHGLDGAEQQGVSRAERRVVRLTAHAGGEDVDVLLDALVGVVDRLTRELAAEVREVAEPVVNEAVAQPDSPPHDEPLHQVQVEEQPNDIARGQDREHHHHHPKRRAYRLPRSVKAT